MPPFLGTCKTLAEVVTSKAPVNFARVYALPQFLQGIVMVLFVLPRFVQGLVMVLLVSLKLPSANPSANLPPTFRHPHKKSTKKTLMGQSYTFSTKGVKIFSHIYIY